MTSDRIKDLRLQCVVWFADDPRSDKAMLVTECLDEIERLQQIEVVAKEFCGSELLHGKWHEKLDRLRDLVQ